MREADPLPIHALHRRLVPPGSPTPMFVHPDDGSIWAFLPGPCVIRMRGEASETIAAYDAVALPDASRALRYQYQVQFYYDTARRAPVWLVSTYGADPEAVRLGAWDGRCFALIEHRGAAAPIRGDGFAFDPVRGVLVHFLGASDTSLERMQARAKYGGVIVRELGADDQWRDVPGLLPELGQSRLFCGWDGRRGKIVVIDEETRRTFAWDGRTWEPLPAFPNLPWEPCAMSLMPGTRELVYLHAERSTDHRALAWALRGDRWQAIDAPGLAQFGGAAYDPIADVSLVAAPWFGPGTIPTQWGTIDADGRLAPRGAPLFPALAGTTAGPPVVWGQAPAAGYQHRRRAEQAVVAALDGDGLAPLPSLPVPAIAIVRAGDALLGVGRTGAVSELDLSAGTWRPKIDGGLPERTAGNVGVDPATGRVLLVSGDPRVGSAYLKDAWLFDGEAWSEVAAKGARPAIVDARVAFHPGLGAWMIVGGHDNKYRPNEKLWLCDGKKWTSHALAWDGADAPDLRRIGLLAWDPASAQLLLVAGDRLWIHAGEGTWRALGRLAAPPATLAYDDRARRLVSYCEAEDWRADLGALLDASAARSPAAPTPAPKQPRARPAKPEPEALPAEVWLRLQDGDTDKFWFAALAGRGWTARWGRRGAKAQEQRKELASAAEARAAYEKQVRAKLKAGYEHAPEREDAARIPGRTAWDIRLGASGDDLFGGVPPGFDASDWPRCADCGHPMQFVALFHADPERLPLAEGAAIAVFACNGHFSSGACETWDADAGCNAAVLVTAEQLARRALTKPPSGPDGEEPIPPMKRRKIAYRARHEVDPDVEDNAEAPDERSKLGGFPAWLQFPDPPDCEACGGAMRFAGQIDERADADLNFGGGIGYLFHCPHGAKFQWQR